MQGGSKVISYSLNVLTIKKNWSEHSTNTRWFQKLITHYIIESYYCVISPHLLLPHKLRWCIYLHTYITTYNYVINVNYLMVHFQLLLSKHAHTWYKNQTSCWAWWRVTWVLTKWRHQIAWFVRGKCVVDRYTCTHGVSYQRASHTFS